MVSMPQFLLASIQDGFKAFKANFIPACILWLIGAFVLWAYYFWPQSRATFNAIESLKSDLGLPFLFFSTGLFGAFIPALFSHLVLRHGVFPFKRTLILFIFWGLKGLEIEYFYLFQNWAFGDNLLLKTFIDEFIYVPLWGLTSVVLFYFFLDCDLSPSRFYHELGPNWFKHRIAKVLIPNWGVWIPAVSFIYSLPQPLQLPLQNLTLAFWVMMLAYLNFNAQKSCS